MPKIDVEEQLKLRFLQPLLACMPRRVVVWHDADGEFAPEFERAQCGLLKPARAACLPSRSSSTAMTL